MMPEQQALKNKLAALSCREGCFVLIPTMDLVFYALGSGEYDEMAREYQGRRLRHVLVYNVFSQPAPEVVVVVEQLTYRTGSIHITQL